MKCPKCHYISFEDVERCRNCGYDFALLRVEVGAPELPLRTPTTIEGPADDFPLEPMAPTPRPGRASEDMPSDAAAPVSNDLPLFEPPVPERGAAVKPAPTLPPLAVRRAAHEAARVTPPAETTRMSFAPVEQPLPVPDTAPLRLVDAEPSEPLPIPAAAPRVEDVASREPLAAPVPRFVAALIDACVIGATDVAVVYLTLRLTELDFSRVLLLPLVPMLGFLAILNGGYQVGFTTASGQTIGKMLTGIRVVGEHASRVPLGQAFVRSAAIVVTVATLGIAYLPALFGSERRALHDRLAGTRVEPA